MGVEGCTKYIKYMLFFFNFIFWLAGVVILGIALYLRHDPKTSSIIELQFDGSDSTRTLYISVYILIAVGAVMMVVGFLGCCGAIQESQCLLGTFFACLVILFACEVAAGIWGYMHKDNVSLVSLYDSVYDEALSKNIIDPEKNKAAITVLKVFHTTLNCCGKSTLTNVMTILTDQIGATDLCPPQPTGDCHSKLQEFSGKFYLLGIAALVVAVIMIFEMIFSMVLCCGIRNSPVY